MPRQLLPWPPGFAGTPAVAVIENAINGKRLGHSLLLHGEDQTAIGEAALAIADRLLNGGGEREPWNAPDRHPDCFFLRPSGKSRIISVDATRELIDRVNVTPSVAPWKVALIHDADRMNTMAANAFLKTLEEPPPNTVLILLTAHPYALTPTIRSRCLIFRFAGVRAQDSGGPWKEWLDDYLAWLGRVAAGESGKAGIADHVFSAYGLVARFKAVLDREIAAAWEKAKLQLPPEIESDEKVAIESGYAVALRAQFFSRLEEATSRFARPFIEAGDDGMRRAYTSAIARLEHGAKLMLLNLNEAVVLEDFLLASLRLWSRR